jgi:hypothetical protein
VLTYNWTLNIKGHKHGIQLQMDTIVGSVGTGSGRIVVDGTIVRTWGCNPFRMIPKGSCEFEIDGKMVSIKSRFSSTSLFFLALDRQEILPIESKKPKTKARRNR